MRVLNTLSNFKLYNNGYNPISTYYKSTLNNSINDSASIVDTYNLYTQGFGWLLNYSTIKGNMTMSHPTLYDHTQVKNVGKLVFNFSNINISNIQWNNPTSDLQYDKIGSATFISEADDKPGSLHQH